MRHPSVFWGKVKIMSIDTIQSISSNGLQQTQTSRTPVEENTTVSEAVAERNKTAMPGQELPPIEAIERENTQEVETAVSKISEFVQSFQRDLTFSVDDATGRTVIKVIDSATEEVIRTIPSEETLRIAERLSSPESLILREQA